MGASFEGPGSTLHTSSWPSLPVPTCAGAGSQLSSRSANRRATRPSIFVREGAANEHGGTGPPQGRGENQVASLHGSLPQGAWALSRGRAGQARRPAGKCPFPSPSFLHVFLSFQPSFPTRSRTPYVYHALRVRGRGERHPRLRSSKAGLTFGVINLKLI